MTTIASSGGLRSDGRVLRRSPAAFDASGKSRGGSCNAATLPYGVSAT